MYDSVLEVLNAAIRTDEGLIQKARFMLPTARATVKGYENDISEGELRIAACKSAIVLLQSNRGMKFSGQLANVATEALRETFLPTKEGE